MYFEPDICWNCLHLLVDHFQAAQFTQAAYHAQAAAHAASQYGGLEAQNAYQNAQQWSNMAQASLMHLHAAQQAATKGLIIATT